MGGFGDPDGLEAAARLLSRDADELRARGRSIDRSSNGLEWRGPAARAFRAVLADDLTSLVRAAAELDEAAAALWRQAAEVREREARLRELADSVTGWFG